MKVFLPTTIKPTGGSSSFAKKLQRGLRAKGHEVTFKFSRDFDILLVNASCPIKYLLYAKIRRIPIAQRLDGVYYPTTIAGSKYRLYNLPLQIIYHYFTNFVIYQSQYSKQCCTKFLGINRHVRQQIIYNGVDTQHFSPLGNKINLRDNPDQQIFITASRFRRNDQILPLLDSFNIYQRQHHPNSKFIIVGNFEGIVKNVPQNFNNTDSIIFINSVDNTELPKYLRSADVFLFSHLNPPCPNNIIEAISCGLPICGVADGAMLELTDAGINSELIPAPSDAFYTARFFNHALFADNLHKIMMDRTKYSQSSRLQALSRFTIRHMVDQYLTIFSSLDSRSVIHR